MLLIVPTLGQKGGNIEFVQDLYRIFLNREAETGGLDFWAGNLAAGRAVRAQTIEAIEKASKDVRDPFLGGKAGQLFRAFRAIVGRDPAQVEFNIYYPMTWEAILNSMYNSQEYLDSAPRAVDDDPATFAFATDDLVDGAMAGGEVSGTLTNTASSAGTTSTLEVVAYVLGSVIVVLIVVVVVLGVMVMKKLQNS